MSLLLRWGADETALDGEGRTPKDRLLGLPVEHGEPTVFRRRDRAHAHSVGSGTRRQGVASSVLARHASLAQGGENPGSDGEDPWRPQALAHWARNGRRKQLGFGWNGEGAREICPGECVSGCRRFPVSISGGSKNFMESR